MLKDIGTSLLKTVIISALVAGGGMLFELPFIQVFAAAICIQFVVFFMWNSVVEYLFRINLQKQQTELEGLYAQQGADVSCAHCSKLNFVPIRFDEDNEFECQHCEQSNAVYVRVTTAQTTDILDTDRLSINTFIKDKIEAITEAQQTEEGEEVEDEG